MAQMIANTCLRLGRLTLQKGNVVSTVRCQSISETIPLSITRTSTIISTRHYAKINDPNREALWAGVTGLSVQGQMKAVRKTKKRKPKLEYFLGEMPTKMLWPGLNYDLFTGRQPLKPTEMKSELGAVKQERQLSQKKKITKLKPLERGYTGRTLDGRRMHPPSPVEGYDFDEHGFEVRILETKIVSNMTSTKGRVRTHSGLVVMGNKNGLAGYGLGKGSTGIDSRNQAAKKAAKNLEFIERYDNHTVLHNLYAKVGATKLFIRRQTKGHGLVCHRVIKTICELIGIRDLYVKIEGSTNQMNITHAFFSALRSQQPFQKLADTKNLHIVELKKENNYYPNVIASPSDGKVRESLKDSEIKKLDFENMFWDNKVYLQRKKHKKFYESQYGFRLNELVRYKRRNQRKAQLERICHGLQRPIRGLRNVH